MMDINAILTLIANQGIGLLIAGLCIFALIKGVPKFFAWLSAQWEELKDVFKGYINEQIETMKELSTANKELVATVSTITSKVDAIEDKVEKIDSKVDKLLEKEKVGA